MECLVLRGRTLSGTGAAVRCAVGYGGVRRNKRKGGSAAPAGTFALRRVLFRPDLLPPPDTGLLVQAWQPADTWCDDPADTAYN